MILIFLISLATVIFVAPHNWDSMTYHLARVAYYLQNGNLGYFDANYWAQAIHPKNSSLLFLFTYLVGGGNENLTQIVQLSSYVVAVFSIYSISRLLDFNKTESIFAALVSALLIEWLMEATTTQNDMILTALTGISVYFLLKFRSSGKLMHLVFVALTIALGLGVKASFTLVIPSISLIALYSLVKSHVTLSLSLRNGLLFIGFLIIAVSALTIPSGPYDNYLQFGNPLGPEPVVKAHAFSTSNSDFVIYHGTKNLLRYTIDFVSLDGLPSIAPVRRLQEWIRYPAAGINNRFGLNLEAQEATRYPFKLSKNPTSHEDTSYWGIWGFGLVFIALIFSITRFSSNTAYRVFVAATLFFFIAQSYSGPYDPWRGRYFVVCAVFSVPLVGLWLRTNNYFIRFYLIIVVFFGTTSSLSAVIFRGNSSVIQISSHDWHLGSIFAMDRIEQLTRNRKNYTEPIRNFLTLVPPGSSIAVYLAGDQFEYPLFGEKLTRKLIPINSFDKGLQEIPVDANFLLYSNGYPCPLSEDIFLGTDWHLRPLNDSNRICS